VVGGPLTAALSAAARELGRIGVMSYSPGATWDHAPGRVPDLAAMGITSALETTPESARAQFDLLMAGALTASRAVLPAMRQAGAGARAVQVQRARTLEPVSAVSRLAKAGPDRSQGCPARSPASWC
jgi:NAD(P)-dependent dehydrogenase (short-subunit alcohol dehydrogenase family)